MGSDLQAQKPRKELGSHTWYVMDCAVWRRSMVGWFKRRMYVNVGILDVYIVYNQPFYRDISWKYFVSIESIEIYDGMYEQQYDLDG